MIDILVPQCVVCTRAFLVIFKIPFVGYGAYDSIINKPKVAGLNSAVVTNVAMRCIFWQDSLFTLSKFTQLQPGVGLRSVGRFYRRWACVLSDFPGGVPSRGVKAYHTYIFRFNVNFYNPNCRKRSKNNFVIKNSFRFTFCYNKIFVLRMLTTNWNSFCNQHKITVIILIMIAFMVGKTNI